MRRISDRRFGWGIVGRESDAVDVDRVYPDGRPSCGASRAGNERGTGRSLAIDCRSRVDNVHLQADGRDRCSTRPTSPPVNIHSLQY